MPAGVPRGGLDDSASVAPMQVADVRRSLCMVRKAWSENRPEQPINLMQVLHCGVPMGKFCFNFVLMHHTKRLQRSTKK